MEKLILKSLFLVVALALAGCTPGEVEDISGLDDYSYVSGNFSQSDKTALHTSTFGTVRFNSTLPGVASSRSIKLKASLNESLTDSSVTVTFYNPQQSVPASSGISVTFTRSGASVTGTITVNGTSRTINSAAMTYFYPTSLDVVMDIHNVGTKPRILIWRRDRTIYGVDTADVDSERDLASPLPNGAATGLFAGLTLERATVTAAQISTPMVLD